uniref:Tumor necrosis factor receptor n=1 Tax=Azumapecten farreri TaxID=106299 RepID=Q0R0H4_AZUFA|nr:tumor necrosis factor receptor precursor [Azumapecten farreri]
MREFSTVQIFRLILTLVPCWSLAVGQNEHTYTSSTGIKCILCPPGYFYFKDCDIPNTIAVCKPCPSGTYSSSYNRAIYCAACMRHCESDVLVKVQECNATMDMVCDCPPGFVLENPTDKFHAKCKPFNGCDPGFGVVEQGTPGHEPVCRKCRPGITFSSEVSWQEPCYPCTQCPNNDVLRECNTTHDTICNFPRPSWRADVALPSLGVNCFFLLAVMIIVGIVIYRRWLPKGKYEPKTDDDEDEEERRPFKPVSSKASSDSGLTDNTSVIEMEALGINWGPIFRMVSRQITANWENVIQSLFQAIDVDECDTIIQSIKNDNQPVSEQIYQCLLKWQQQTGSQSTDVLVRILTEKSYHELVQRLQTYFQLESTTNPDTD